MFRPPRGHSIPMGVYDIPVKASNLKARAETTLKLTVNENPYYFDDYLRQ